MKFEVSAKIEYEVSSPSTVLLNIQPYIFSKQEVESEMWEINPLCRRKELVYDSIEKRVQVIEIIEPCKLTIEYSAIVENEIRKVSGEELDDVPIARMPPQALSYLNQSRYCQSDRLFKFAANKFGNIENAYQKVNSICNWIYQNVEYLGGYTTPQTSAFDTITEQVGVCRDFAHLGIALCRALTIPARYLTCYAFQLQPQDFHACFEAYIGGYWIIFDATRLVPIEGLVKIATGPDAADTSFGGTFGNIQFQQLKVSVKSVNGSLPRADDCKLTQGCYFG